MLVAAIIRGPKPPASSTGVPEAVRDVLARGLAVDPDNRWPDVDTLIAELERAAASAGALVFFRASALGLLARQQISPAEALLILS